MTDHRQRDRSVVKDTATISDLLESSLSDAVTEAGLRLSEDEWDTLAVSLVHEFQRRQNLVDGRAAKSRSIVRHNR